MKPFSRTIRARGAFGDHVVLWEPGDEAYGYQRPWRLMVEGWVHGTAARGSIDITLTETGLRRLRDACDAALPK